MYARQLSSWTLLVACAAALGSSCTPEESTEQQDAGVPDATKAEEQTTATEKEANVGLQRPAHGFRVRSVGAEIPTGADLELCEVAQLPGDPREKLYANRFELGNGPNSHHLIVYAIERGSPAEAKAKQIGLGNPVECVGIDNRFGRQGVQRIAGSQQPYQNTEMPDGVGRVFDGGQLIVFNYHYLNLEDHPVHARSAISFHVTSEANVEHVAQEFGMTNFTFAVDPNTSNAFVGECHVTADITLSALVRHTHHWGSNFTAWFAGGERDGEEIWTSSDWENDAAHNFEEPVQMKAGEGLRFKCGFDNTTDRMLRFGTSASDEMCILFGLAWPTQPGQILGKLGCDIVWVDDKGIGHPANEAGGIPTPDEQSAATCRAFAKGSCSQCRCGACAKSMVACGTDADCSAVTSCYGACPAGTDCNDTCRQTLDEHSSAVGLLTQMNTCFAGTCPEACAQP